MVIVHNASLMKALQQAVWCRLMFNVTAMGMAIPRPTGKSRDIEAKTV